MGTAGTTSSRMMETPSPLTDSMLVTGITIVLFFGYKTLWNKVTAVPILAPIIKPEQASRGKMWCHLWSAAILFASSFWLVIKAFGIQTRGEDEYKDFLVSVVGGGKSLLGLLGNDIMLKRCLYLAVLPFCLENSLASGAASPKTISLLYFFLPLSHVWLLLHQFVMGLIGGGSTFNQLWLASGVLDANTMSPELDLLYWAANIFYAATFAVVAIVSAKGGSPLGPFFKKCKDAKSVRIECKKFLYFYLNVFALVYSVILIILNIGIPDPTRPGEHLIKPMDGGIHSIYNKNYDQVLVFYCYMLLAGTIFPALRDTGNGWVKANTIDGIGVFLTAYSLPLVINYYKGGHPLHPSWVAEGAPYTTTWLLERLFFFATVNWTVIQTNINIFSIIGHLPLVVYKPFETCAKNIRTNMVFYGYLTIFVHGFWTYAAACGLTVPFEFLGLKEKISHPPIHHCNVKYVVLVHRHHLYLSVMTAAIGVIVYDVEEYLKKNFSAGLSLKSFSSFWIKMLWASILLSMVSCHMQVIPACHKPLVENGEMTLFSAVNYLTWASFIFLRFFGGAYFLHFIIKASKYYSQKYVKAD